MAGTEEVDELELAPPPLALALVSPVLLAKVVNDNDGGNSCNNEEASIERRLVGGACRKDPTYGLFFVAPKYRLPIRTEQL